MPEIGRQIRLNRLLRNGDRGALIIAYDHAQMLGPIPGTERPGGMLKRLVRAQVDGVLLSLGGLKTYGAALLEANPPGVVVRLDWTNVWYRQAATSSGDYACCSVASVEDAVCHGADAVITYLFLGSGDAGQEAAEIRKNAEVTRACERYGMPHAVESMARGRDAPNPYDPELVRQHTRIAAELGADLIKTDYTGDPESMRSVVDCCPVPVLVAGGPRGSSDTQSLDMLRGVWASGAAGVIFGRNVFQASDVDSFIAEAREAMRTPPTAASLRA